MPGRPGRQASGAKPHHDTQVGASQYRGRQPIPVPANQRSVKNETIAEIQKANGEGIIYDKQHA